MSIATSIIPSAHYRFLVTDLRNNTILDDLPLQKVTYSNALSKAGSIVAEIQINLDTKIHNLKEHTAPGKTGLYVVRNGVPVWGGIIWKRQYSAPDRTLRIDGATFESYLFRRFQRSNFTWKREDQLKMARSIIGSVFDQVGVTVDSNNSGVYRERNLYKYEFKTIGDELQTLSDLINGFDWNVDISLDDSGLVFNRELKFYYPKKGVTKEDTTISFEYPGIISDVTYSEDAENGVNKSWAVGAGESEEQLEKFATDSAGGWPILEDVENYKDVVIPATLQNHADSDLVRLRTPIEIAEITVRADREPFLGTYSTGDWARFVLNDLYFDPALTVFMRIIEYTVSVDDKGLERVKLTLNTERNEETD